MSEIIHDCEAVKAKEMIKYIKASMHEEIVECKRKTHIRKK